MFRHGEILSKNKINNFTKLDAIVFEIAGGGGGLNTH